MTRSGGFGPNCSMRLATWVAAANVYLLTPNQPHSLYGESRAFYNLICQRTPL